MIVSKIIGGLGNQMFQYAVGRQLAEHINSELKLDISDFAHYELYGFGLSNFNIRADIASKEDLRPFIAARKARRGLRRLIPNFTRRSARYVKEASLRFNPDILTLPDQSYLDGYWQSEKYFSGIRRQLLQDFTLKAPPSPGFSRLADQIQTTQAAALHIRRGDYANNQTTLRVHGLCPLEYYQQAARELSSRHGQLVFFVFSDDIAWAKTNLTLPYPMFFAAHELRLENYEEMLLMSLCQHNIIANSTFSWWGAWLNQHPNKTVIAPAKWFNDRSKDATDLVPADWKKM